MSASVSIHFNCLFSFVVKLNVTEVGLQSGVRVCEKTKKLREDFAEKVRLQNKY